MSIRLSWPGSCVTFKRFKHRTIAASQFLQRLATIALKMAASALRTSQTYLGAQFRRFRTKLGAPFAIKAMAAKLARLVYRMLRYGMNYVDQGVEFYEAQLRKLQIQSLKSKA